MISMAVGQNRDSLNTAFCPLSMVNQGPTVLIHSPQPYLPLSPSALVSCALLGKKTDFTGVPLLFRLVDSSSATGACNCFVSLSLFSLGRVFFCDFLWSGKSVICSSLTCFNHDYVDNTARCCITWKILEMSETSKHIQTRHFLSCNYTAHGLVIQLFRGHKTHFDKPNLTLSSTIKSSINQNTQTTRAKVL